jgi:murein DD-endopeptidase MepM/ murein hydrolase activator NlpD
MRVRFASIVWAALFGARILAQVAPDPHTITLTLVAGPKSVPPGGVALITVRASEPLAGLEGHAFGRPVWFWADADVRTYHALVATGLDAKPGAYTVTATASGEEHGGTATFSLRVEPKRFETRRLKVDPQFVNPPVSEAERITTEQKQMAAIFAEVTPMRLWHGAFDMPVPGQATSSYGRLSVLNGESRGRHQGADFRAATGTPVHAPNAGRVALAADLYFSGNTVILDHGLGMFSLLAHLSRISVEAGAMVERGDLLGDSGATGRVTGPHLHWALRLGNASVDPIALVAAVAPIRDER